MFPVLRFAHIACRKQFVVSAVPRARCGLCMLCSTQTSCAQLLTTSMHVRMQLKPAGLPALAEPLLLLIIKLVYSCQLLLQLEATVVHLSHARHITVHLTQELRWLACRCKDMCESLNIL